jgi:hypothetical protein
MWNKCSENIIKITKLKINGKLGNFGGIGHHE